MPEKITPQIICDIIQHGLELSSDQIWIYNQRRDIPSDKRIYVVVGLASSNVYGNSNRFDGSSMQGYDQISTLVQETISIDVFSYTTEAIQKYPAVIACLSSTYGRQVQEKMGIKISPVPMSINDTTAIEGAANLFRMSIFLQVLTKYDTIFKSDYYDDFYNEVYTETGLKN